MAENMTSLLGLEDELTCSICLCLFDKPVSLICGHSFCENCLEETWRGGGLSLSLSCPQCRMVFSSKPELKKNTVLAAVLDAYRVRAGCDESVQEPSGEKKKDPEGVKCDSCMEAKAVKTCLTCMASYCEEHVRPHRENPVFRAHQLCEPLADLAERLCSAHGKPVEFYCAQHRSCICSSCLQIEHKGCDFITADERRSKQKTDLTDKLNILNVKIDKNQQVITQMKEQQSKLKDLATTRKRILEAEYRQIREMIDRDEKEALQAIDKEQEKGQIKLVSMMKKFDENVEKMNRTKSEINIQLDQSQSFTFLKALVDLPQVVNFEPYAPRLNVDSKEVIAYHSSTVALKDWITKLMECTVENRIFFIKPGFMGETALLPSPRDMRDTRASNHPHPSKVKAQGSKKSHHNKSENSEKKEYTEQRFQKPNRARTPQKGMSAAFSKSMENLCDFKPRTVDIADINQPISSFVGSNAVKRNDLLKYGADLKFDIRTAHKRIILSENNTKASVSDDPASYPDHHLRFTVCSQVLCSKGFSQGRHYWEIKMSSNNFCGLGLAYRSIDRKGPASRLGRNAESWCVEWFNVKLSAWYNSTETVLENPNPTRVGVLLDCEDGSATFYNVQDRAYPFHTFVFPFTEPVYPAFWGFSNGSSISLCKLNN